MDTEVLLQEQIDYYRARAGEYDEWWFRQGRYDRGAEFNTQWHRETAALDAAVSTWLDQRGPRSVLELACGTGLFTRHLAPRVERVTAVDASPEAIAINRARVGAANVDYRQADLFDWQPATRYDAVFFSFWLSHVPLARFARFWTMVASALAPDGSIFLIDSAFDPTSTAKDHVLRHKKAGVVARKLNDGRQFHIVKLFYRPDELAERLDAIGWSADMAQTTRYFIYGEARPRAR